MKKLFTTAKKNILKSVRNVFGIFSASHARVFKKTTKKQFYFHKKIALLLLFVIIVGVIAPIGINTAQAQAKDTVDYIKDTALGVWGYMGDVITDPADAILGGLANLATKAVKAGANEIMVFGAFLLDESLTYSIQSQHFKFTGIQNAWKVFRDVANMTFIFILLYIAFATILQLGGSYKRMLVTLIIIALLINFSFFFTGIIIDTSNILALFLYNIITDGGTITMSEQFGNVMQLNSIFGKGTYDTLGQGDKAAANLGATFFFILAFFVFLSAAILFVLRTIALMFVLILAPLAFAAVILPATKSNFNKWLHHLINYSFVAPVYLLGILVVLIMIPDMFSLSGAEAKALARGDTSIGIDKFNIFLGFIMVFGLLAGVLAISRSMADKIGGLSVKYAGKITGLAAGAAAWGTRKTVGAASRAARDSETLQKLAKSDNIATRYAGRAALRTADYGARSSFDARRGIQGGLGAAGIKTDLGRPGGKGGYEADVKRRDKKRAEFTAHLDEKAQEAYMRDIESRSPGGIRRTLAAAASESGVANEEKKGVKKTQKEKKNAEKQLREAKLNMAAGVEGAASKVAEAETVLEVANTKLKQSLSALRTASPYEADKANRVQKRVVDAAKIRGDKAQLAQIKKALEDLGYEEKDQTTPEPKTESDDNKSAT